MPVKNKFNFRSKINLSIYFLILLICIFPHQPSISSNANFLDRLIRLINRPKETGAPSNRRRAARSRTETCRSSPDSLPLTALLPIYIEQPDDLNFEKVGYIKELAASTTPTLWFYVPYQSSESEPLLAKLRILDANLSPLLEDSSKYQLIDTPGFVGISFPAILERHTDYRWYFSIICEQDRPARDPVVDGYIRVAEIKPQLEQLDTSVGSANYTAYLENDIWHDMLDSLVGRYSEDKSNKVLRNHWNAVLEVLDLEELQNEPILDCCLPVEKDQKNEAIN